MATVRALICADSPGYAAALRRVLEHDGDVAVAAVCGRAEDMIAALPAVDPDLIALDMVLPGMDSLAAVEEIMSSRPVPILVLLTATAGRREKAAAALAAGALDAVAKNDLDLGDPASRAATAFRQRVRTLGRAHVIRHPRARLRAPIVTHYASVVGVCASAGGPQAFAAVVAELPADYPIPILLVQHIAAGFTEGLARWLNHNAGIPVALAPDGERVTPGVWIAPEGAHLTLGVTGRFRLGDGAAGAAEVLRHGGLAMAQDEQSSAIFGMPQSAISQGVDLVLPPAGIASYLLRLSHRRLGRAR